MINKTRIKYQRKTDTIEKMHNPTHVGTYETEKKTINIDGDGFHVIRKVKKK